MLVKFLASSGPNFGADTDSNRASVTNYRPYTDKFSGLAAAQEASDTDYA